MFKIKIMFTKKNMQTLMKPQQYIKKQLKDQKIKR